MITWVIVLSTSGEWKSLWRSLKCQTWVIWPPRWCPVTVAGLCDSGGTMQTSCIIVLLWTRSRPTFSLCVTSIKLQGLQRWATTEIYIVCWCSEYSAVPHLDWFTMPGVVNFQYKRQSEVRVFLWVFVANIWMHTDKAVRLGMKSDLDSLCYQELMIFRLKCFSLWLNRVKLSAGSVNLYYV